MTDERQDDPLEAAFAAARADGDETAPLPDGLLARLVADAEAARPPVTAPASRGRARGGLGQLLDRLFAGQGTAMPGFGWPAATGLAASALVGLWLGYAPPASLAGLSTLSAALLGASSADTDPASPGAILAPLDFGGLDV
jgi:hypothetical protein